MDKFTEEAIKAAVREDEKAYRLEADRRVEQLTDELGLARAEIERLREAIDQALDDMAYSYCVCQATKQMLIAVMEQKP